MDKKLLAVMFAAGIIVTGIWLLFFFNTAVHEHSEVSVAHTAVAKMEKISLWQFGKEKVIEMDTKLANNLISTLEKVNLQGTCTIFEEDVEKLKQEGRIIEITFREPINVTISQWIKPEDRNHISIDASGYRILTNVEKAVFVLKGDCEGNILTKSADVKGYGCWAISKDGKIDKSWIDEIEKALKLNYKVEEFSVFEPENNEWSAHLRLHKAGECGEFGEARFEYVEVRGNGIVFSAIFYPYCNAVVGKNLFADVEKSGNNIFVRLIFNDYKAAKCLCPFKVEGNVSVGEGEYNLVILFDNKFSNEERVLCSKTVKIGG